MNFLVFFSLFSVAFCQTLVPLNSFKGGNQKNLLPGTAPYGIYVSATSDASSALLNIFVVTADGTQKSLNELKSRKVNGNSGELSVYTITDSAYLTTTLTNNDMSRLHGVMFISSSKQLNDGNFHVFDLSGAFTRPSQNQGFLTYLFLNTHMGTNPYQSSIISSWTQNANTYAYIYAGVPTDQQEIANHQIFSNPVNSDKNFQPFIKNVEKFSITMASFYMKTSMGAPGFRIEPGYVSINGMTTTAYTTTGFYMKAKGQTDNLIKIYTRRDTKYSGVAGANMLGSLPTQKQVTVGVYDGASKYEDVSVANPFFSPWSVPYIGERFEISSTGGTDGEYYVQYFTYQGTSPANVGTTVPGRVVTNNPGGGVETTTKSSGSLQFLMSLIVSMGFIRNL